MRSVIQSSSVSLDGYIAGPGGDISWGVPDEEQHQFHNDETAKLGAHLLGRRLYETMVFWETAEEDPDAGPVMLEFAQIWKALPKVVFSSTLDRVEGNTRLATGGLAEEIAALKEQPGGDIGIGGPGLAAAAVEQGLVDEFRLFTVPVVLGAGTPYFPPVERRFDLELLETRTFASKVVYTRYRRI
jgi:dihydrofolate reductase